MTRYDKCKTGKDFTREILSDPKLVDYRWSGDHLTGHGPKGRFTVAAGKYEYPPFLRKKIINLLIAVGLGMIVIFITIQIGVI